MGKKTPEKQQFVSEASLLRDCEGSLKVSEVDHFFLGKQHNQKKQVLSKESHETFQVKCVGKLFEFVGDEFHDFSAFCPIIRAENCCLPMRRNYSYTPCFPRSTITQKPYIQVTCSHTTPPRPCRKNNRISGKQDIFIRNFESQGTKFTATRDLSQ